MLQTYLDQAEISRARAAAFFGISEPYLSQLINGRRRPSGMLAARIEHATGGQVPASSWFGARAGGDPAQIFPAIHHPEETNA